MTPLLSQATVVSSARALLQEAVGLNGVVMFMSSGAPGMVLVVVRGPDTVIQGYGETSKGNGIQPEALGRARQ